MATFSVRYIVDDVGEAIAFYTRHLGFGIEFNPAPGFAILSRGDMRLLLNAPGAGGAGQVMPDGRKPEPGGWNRIQLEVHDLASESRVCATRGRTSAATSLAAGVESRSCWRTHPATPSNSSNPQGTDVVVSGQLEDEGLVRIEQSAGRKVAHLTDEGRAYVQKHRNELVTPWETATRTTARSFLSYVTSLDRCRWPLCRWRKQAPTARSSRRVGYWPIFGANSTGY